MVCGFAELGYRLWGLLFGGNLSVPLGPSVGPWPPPLWRRWHLLASQLWGPGGGGSVALVMRAKHGAGPSTAASVHCWGLLGHVRSPHSLRTGWAGVLGNTYETKPLSQGAPSCSFLHSADPGPGPPGPLNVAPALVDSATLQAPRPRGLCASTLPRAPLSQVPLGVHTPP